MSHKFWQVIGDITGELFAGIVLRIADRLLTPNKPGHFFFSLEDLNMGNRFRVTITLPPLAEGEAGEVVKRGLTRIINGGEGVVADIPADQLTFEHEALQGDVINYELVNIDDANNVSPARTGTFTVTDTIAPAAPGEMGFAAVEEADPA